jgi:hypothetical protein
MFKFLAQLIDPSLGTREPERPVAVRTTTRVAIRQELPVAVVAPKPEPKFFSEEIALRQGEEILVKTYAQMALAVNFRPAELIRAELRVLLKELGVEVYDLQSVLDFLDHRYGVGGSRRDNLPGWTWHPLTEADATAAIHVWSRRYVGGPSPSGLVNHRVSYQKLVPFEVLQLVKTLKAKIPELFFYVSEVGLPNPDPFLLVNAKGMQEMVIAHWDEPGYQIKTEKI